MEEINFEEAMKKLEQITAELEKGDLSLDEAVKKFEEGIKLSKECNKMVALIKYKSTPVERSAASWLIEY